MPVYQLIEDIIFPPLDEAEEDGLLAVGGDLSPERVLFALSIGIFPWFSKDEPILWWSPNPRYVVFSEKARISKSLKQSLKKFEYKINSDFKSVMTCCAETKRKDQDETWITNEMIDTYTKLHEYGFAISFEAYYRQELVGGLYGVRLGDVFIGESMFHKKTDAGKCCYKLLIDFCLQEGIKIIDCQIHTDLLENLGGEFISREDYSKYLLEFVESPFAEAK